MLHVYKIILLYLLYLPIGIVLLNNCFYLLKILKKAKLKSRSGSAI